MVIRILCYLLFLVSATWLGLHLSQQPGYILINYSNINIETSLWFALLLAIALFIALYLVLAALKDIWRTATRLGTSSEHKKLELAIAAITSASYENWPATEKALHKYASGNNLLARVALSYIKSQYDLMGSIAELQQLYLKHPEHGKFILLVKAYIYFSYNKYNDAVCTIECLAPKDRNTDYFNYILIKCYYQIGDAANIKELLPKCSKILPAAEYHEISLYYYMAELRSKDENLNAIWKKIPETFKQEHRCLLIYIKALSKSGEKTAAQKLLLKYIPSRWDAALLQEYIIITPKPEAITQMTRWHEQNKQEPSLLMALARLHLEHQALATSFYQKALTITHDNSTLFEIIAYYIEINNISEATKLIKILANKP